MINNGHLALALLIIKVESCQTGMDQLRESLGVADEEKWKHHYLPKFDNPDQVLQG
jgi:hypothetical protein